MKKFFSSLCVFAIICLLAFSGCSSESSNDASEWVEVQSITYYIDTTNYQHTAQEKKLTSYIYAKIKDRKQITESEYTEASQELKTSFFAQTDNLDIPENRNETIKQIKKLVGKTIYSNYWGYQKYFFESYEIRYVKVRFINSDCLEINYVDSKSHYIKILPLSYEITYFED